MSTLLFVDDDVELLEIISAEFSEKAYEVHTLESAVNIEQQVEKIMPDCIILDVMMPEIDGFAAFANIRKANSTPIIFLTGKISEDDKVNGILMGADDYIEKPFSFRELEARIRMVIKRNSTGNTSTLNFASIEINTLSRVVLCDGQELALTAREYDLLLMLATSKEKIITYEQIGTHLWGTYRKEDRGSVMVNVSRLRKKLEADPLAAHLLETVWGKGYSFNGGKA